MKDSTLVIGTIVLAVVLHGCNNPEEPNPPDPMPEETTVEETTVIEETTAPERTEPEETTPTPELVPVQPPPITPEPVPEKLPETGAPFNTEIEAEAAWEAAGRPSEKPPAWLTEMQAEHRARGPQPRPCYGQCVNSEGKNNAQIQSESLR